MRTTDENPIYTKKYRYPGIYKVKINEQIEKPLQDKII